jgi:hypothetical protein
LAVRWRSFPWRRCDASRLATCKRVLASSGSSFPRRSPEGHSPRDADTAKSRSRESSRPKRSWPVDRLACELADRAPLVLGSSLRRAVELRTGAEAHSRRRSPGACRSRRGFASRRAPAGGLSASRRRSPPTIAPMPRKAAPRTLTSRRPPSSAALRPPDPLLRATSQSRGREPTPWDRGTPHRTHAQEPADRHMSRVRSFAPTTRHQGGSAA